MPFAMADLRVGQSADGSVADTMRALAPLVIAAWMAGICEAAVAAVPLVSVPLSPSALSAARAPPDCTLSAVVKYGLPRFFGITKTFNPVFSPAAALEEELADEVEDVGDEADVELPDELHAASVADATRSTAGAHSALLMEPVISESFQFGPNMTSDGCGCGHAQSFAAPMADLGAGFLLTARPRARPSKAAALGTNTLMSRRPPVTMPVAS